MILTLADLNPIRVQMVRAERATRPHWRYLLGCERCGTPCHDIAPCHCCKINKTRTAGGTLNVYPDDGKGHYRICEVADV